MQLEITSVILTFVSATFDDISTEFLLSYLYIKGAECLECFLSSISMQREKKIEKQFKETVQKHKTCVPGWHSVVSQKALHLHLLGLRHTV